MKSIKTGIIAVIFLLAVSQLSLAKIEPQTFAGLKARSIGPANMSGRIGALDAVASNPNIIYVGGAGGGVWKSTNGGTSWTPVFDDQPVSSIGAIAINQSYPDIVWVGTGESAPRNSVGVGRGVYQTLDGGKTWKLLGLEKTEKISKILLHPRDPNVAYVGALGPTWGDGKDRGVYKTSDGGKTWNKILFVDEKTGVADMAMDPANPNKIIAAFWEYRRWPWFFNSGGPGSALYITVDGGENWQKLTDKNGLPKGDLGRIGIAFATNKPNVVYALVEAKRSVLLSSHDGGFNWQVVNDQENVDNRPFYYSHIAVNPVNENILYMLHGQMMVSEDGGKTFTRMTSFGQSHSDYHVIWTHPDGETMVVGNDGGVVISYNRGQNWRFVRNLPLGQFYHVGFDMEFPYNVYGGLQDNGSWRGPAYALKERILSEDLWKTVGGGDGFDTWPDPENSKAGYTMSQGGELTYFDTTTGLSKNIVPTESDVKDRYNWNAGFAIDPFHPATIYLGSQFVHRSPDKGKTWEIISPDLTTNDPTKQKQIESGGLTLDVTNAENYTTIVCIAPSPLQEGVIWVGTDDGNVQLTRDGGKSWELVSKTMSLGKKPLVPSTTWVSTVRASKFDAATAYVTFDDHRRSNWTPYVFVTHDFGKTWKSLATPEIDGFCYVIEEDTVKKDLLFLGTEFGLFVSFNGGGNWMKWTQGVPPVPVFDLAVQPRESDLIIGTHGRSIYIIDDITPLREFSEELTQKKLFLFKVQDSCQFQQGNLSSYLSPGDAAFAGDNKRSGACFTYYLIPSEKKAEASEPEQGTQRPRESRGQMGGMMQFRGMGTMAPASSRLSITILDGQGKTINQFKGTEDKGINRAYWNLREQPPRAEESRQPQEFEFFRGGAGISVLPGTYTVKLKYDDQEVSQSFTVKTDPRLKADIEILKANYEMAKAAQQMSETVNSARRQIQDAQKAIKTIQETLRADRSDKTKELVKAAGELDKKLKDLSEILDPTPPKQGIIDTSEGLSGQVREALFGISGARYDPVSQAAKVKYDKVKVKAAAFLEKVNALFQTDVENFKKLLQDSGFSLFGSFKPLKLEEQK